MRYILLIFVVSAVFCCKPRSLDSEEKYAIPKELDLKGTIFDLLNKPGASLKVCLYNENPNSQLGKAYLDHLEADFQEGLYSWLSVASQHPAWKGPSKPKVQFFRVDAGIDIRNIIKFRENLDPAILDKLNAYIDGPHKNFEESAARYEKIAELIDLKALHNETPQCNSSVWIMGFTSKSDAQVVQQQYQPFGSNLYFHNEIFATRLRDLWTRLALDAIKDPKEREKRRAILQRLNGGNVWSRAFADAYGPLIAIGLPMYTLNDLGAESPQGEVPNLGMSNGKWVMIHEIGHLFLLKDVYVEDESGSALKRHPNALMGNHIIAKGTIQDDDKEGLFTILDNLASGKIKSCSKGYKELENSMDFRASGLLYCIPSTPFKSQQEIGDSEMALYGRFYETDSPTSYDPNSLGPNYHGPANNYPNAFGCVNSGTYSTYSGKPQKQPQVYYPNTPTNYLPPTNSSGPISNPGPQPQQGTPYNPCAEIPTRNQ